ncbi:hypothetical protein PCE1_003489 [Barthelona sp. PCE]
MALIVRSEDIDSELDEFDSEEEGKERILKFGRNKYIARKYRFSKQHFCYVPRTLSVWQRYQMANFLWQICFMGDRDMVSRVVKEFPPLKLQHIIDFKRYDYFAESNNVVGFTPLMASLYTRNEYIAMELIFAGCNVDSPVILKDVRIHLRFEPSVFCIPPIVMAYHKGCHNVYALLRDKVQIDYEYEKGANLLHILAEQGMTLAFKDLSSTIMNQKKNVVELVNTRDKFNKMPLHYAIEGRHVKVAEYLIDEFKADFEALDPYGISPLHEAVRTDQYAMCLMMLTRGANPNKIWAELYQSPLHAACIVDNLAIISLLLQHGARLDVFDMFDNPPMFYLTNDALHAFVLHPQCCCKCCFPTLPEVVLPLERQYNTETGQILPVDVRSREHKCKLGLGC